MLFESFRWIVCPADISHFISVRAGNRIYAWVHCFVSHFQIYQLYLTVQKKILKKIEKKGITKAHLAKMIGINAATLSRILSGKQAYVGGEIIEKIDYYLDRINSDDENILKNYVKNI
jgi:DNA-binding Xre family transcriptional regulator